MDFRVAKKVVIDPYRGGDDIGSNTNNIIEKDYNLDLSKYIYDRLRALNIPVSITRNNDETLDMNNRINRIKSFYGSGNDVIVISNALTTGGDGAEVVYALRNSNNLSNRITNELSKVGLEVNKSYQRRLPSDTSKDYNQLIRDTSNNETLIIYYGSIDNSTEANFLKNNLEEVGEAIVIALANYLGVSYIPLSGSNYYIVQKGDSLYSISKKFNTTVIELKELNNLSTNNLDIGQTLKIPTSSEEETLDSNQVIYTVKSGDNLYSIANKYNTTVDAIKDLNNLSSNILFIGQNLKIPSYEKIENENYFTYKVKSGDSLYSIAKKFNTTVNMIKEYNNLSSNLLTIGQNLKIPPNTTNNPVYLNYQVISGDNLYSIAKKYNTTVDAIKNLNNLISNTLSIGQILKIPTNQSSSQNYQVKSGDTLYSIARRFNTTATTIKELNNLTSNLLTIGQILKIPTI